MTSLAMLLMRRSKPWNVPQKTETESDFAGLRPVFGELEEDGSKPWWYVAALCLTFPPLYVMG
jgi:hypothetical protein